MTDVDPKLNAAGQALVDQATLSVQSLAGLVPSEPEFQGLGYADSDVRLAFDRSSVAQAYADAYEAGQDGTAKDVIAAKMQSDLMSSLERDLRLARRTRIQSVAAEIGRRTGHARPDGPIQGSILYEVKKILQLDQLPQS